MSSSPKASALVRVRVSVNDSSEVFLVNHAFELVSRSVGPLDDAVPPGLYKVKFRHGDLLRQETLVVMADATTIEVPVPEEFSRGATFVSASGSPAPPAAVPTVGPAVEIHEAATRKSGAGSEQALRRARATPPMRVGALSITISQAVQAGIVPGTGVRLLDERGRQVADLESDSLTSSGQATLELPDLRPGAHRLRLTRPGLDTLEQTLVVCRGWRTDVQLGMRNYALYGDSDVWGADIADATMLMVRRDRPEISTDVVGYSRVVKAWLAGPQHRIATAHAQRLVQTSVDDPLFGICLGHALVRQTELDRAAGVPEPRARRELVRSLVTALLKLVPGHPDLQVLRVWLGIWTKGKFAAPPMLVNSWRILSAAAARHAGLVPANSVTAFIADRVWTSPTWLIWVAPDELVSQPAKSRASRAGLIVRLAKTQREHPADEPFHDSERTRDFSDLERVVSQTVGQIAKSDDRPRATAEKAMRRLGVPAATFDRALRSLVDKLKA